MLRIFAKAVLGTLRAVLLAVLLLVSRVLVPLLRLVAAAGMVVLGFCALAMREQTVAMWAGAGVAVVAVGLELALGAAVRALMPSDVVVISEV
jgi:hypothetical protein